MSKRGPKNTGTGNTPEEKFWSRVNKNGPVQSHMDSPCWEWTACLYVKGYGSVYLNGKGTRTHRAAWFYATGEMPTLNILHSCDNRKCVNPSHLREGTNKDNSADMKIRNRIPRGEKNGGSRLNAAQVIEIRKQYANGGGPYRELGEAFGVSGQAIRHIVHRETWAHLVEDTIPQPMV